MKNKLIIEKLENAGINFQLTKFPEKIYTAQGVADALKMNLSQIAKAMLFKISEHEYGIALLTGDRRVNLKSLSQLCGGNNVELVKRDEVERITGFPVGAISPLINILKPEIKVFVDNKILNETIINISAGDLEIGLSINPSDLLKVVNAKIDDISE